MREEGEKEPGRKDGGKEREKEGENHAATKMAPLFLSALMNSTEDPLDLKPLAFLFFKALLEKACHWKSFRLPTGDKNLS